MMMRSCLIALAVLHMGCNPQSKPGNTRDSSSKQSDDSLPQTRGNTTTPAKLKITKTKLTGSPGEADDQPEETQEVIFEADAPTKSASPAPKVAKQKMRSPQTQTQTL